MLDLFEDPWISLCTTSDHKTVTSGLFFHTNHILRTQNITVSDDRNGYCLFYLTDNIPVRFAGIILLSGSSMYRYRRHATAFRDFCDLHGIDMFLIKAFSNFHRHRFFHRFYHLGQNLFHQLRIFHQCRSLMVIHHFWHRTAHIEIKDLKGTLLDLRCHSCQNIRIWSEQLQWNRMFLRMNLHQ